MSYFSNIEIINDVPKFKRSNRMERLLKSYSVKPAVVVKPAFIVPTFKIVTMKAPAPAQEPATAPAPAPAPAQAQEPATAGSTSVFLEKILIETGEIVTQTVKNFTSQTKLLKYCRQLRKDQIIGTGKKAKVVYGNKVRFQIN